MKSPKKSPNNVSKCIVWAKGMFFIYIICYFILTSYHPPRCSITQHVATTSTTLHTPAPRTATSTGRRSIEKGDKTKKGSQAALSFFFTTSPPPSLFLPTKYTYNYLYVYSTHFFLVFCLLCRFPEHVYEQSYTHSGPFNPHTYSETPHTAHFPGR